MSDLSDTVSQCGAFLTVVKALKETFVPFLQDNVDSWHLFISKSFFNKLIKPATEQVKG